MKLLFSALLVGLIVINLQAQAPNKIAYQAVARTTTGELIKNENVAIRVSLLRESISGKPAYVESHDLSTSANGVLFFYIGSGEPIEGNFGNLLWGTTKYFLQLELDTAKSGDFIFLGTSEIVSVPYALFAQEAEHSKTASTIENIPPTGQSSTNYYAEGFHFAQARDTAYKEIMSQNITVPTGNYQTIFEVSGSCYGSTWNAFASGILAIEIDGEVPYPGGTRRIIVVTDDNLSSGPGFFHLRYPNDLAPGQHTIRVLIKADGLQNETSIIFDNQPESRDRTTLNVTFLKK